MHWQKKTFVHLKNPIDQQHSKPSFERADQSTALSASSGTPNDTALLVLHSHV